MGQHEAIAGIPGPVQRQPGIERLVAQLAGGVHQPQLHAVFGAALRQYADPAAVRGPVQIHRRKLATLPHHLGIARGTVGGEDGSADAAVRKLIEADEGKAAAPCRPRGRRIPAPDPFAAAGVGGELRDAAAGLVGRLDVPVQPDERDQPRLALEALQQGALAHLRAAHGAGDQQRGRQREQPQRVQTASVGARSRRILHCHDQNPISPGAILRGTRLPAARATMMYGPASVSAEYTMLRLSGDQIRAA